MRTIKFRAFILGAMYDVKAIDFDDEHGITITTSGGFYNIGHGTKDEHGHLMQYTGLKDKNGVEIYEGDIVKINDMFIDEVIFIVGCFCMKKQMFNYEFTYQNPEHIEVVGTIHDMKHEGEEDE